MAKITSDALNILLVHALQARGFSLENSRALARQTVWAEEMGQANVGVAHVFDYIEGPRDGRINGMAEPSVSCPAPTMIHVNGNGGLPQTGFDRVYDDMVEVARKLGVCIFLHKNASLCGSLGFFVSRLADTGLVAFAATNGTPLMAGSGGTRPVFCTNPMAFAAPQAAGPHLLIDQSSSATAYVNIRAAAEQGESIPLDWALDRSGQPTTNPKAAMNGALLAFGGSRGANIALMVEILAGGLTSANWSLDAASFSAGDTCPATGLFVLAINPEPVDSSFSVRMRDYLKRLVEEYGLYVPGLRKAQARSQAAIKGISVDDALIQRLESYIRQP